MPIRLAACDPCRRSKVACDHARPRCSRCRDCGRAASCTYRARPFKHTSRAVSATTLGSPSGHTRHSKPDVTTAVPGKTRRYPNPGYLGSSSHAAIYNHLEHGHSSEPGVSAQGSDDAGYEAFELHVDNARISHGVNLIKQFQTSLDLARCKQLVSRWISSGSNLGLAASFTNLCVEYSEVALNACVGKAMDVSRLSRNIFSNSCGPLRVHAATTLQEYQTNLGADNIRWETFGLFFAAISYATIDVSVFEPLYDTEKDRREIQKLAMYYSDQCLDICLSLDCLNDLQLMLQYENFVVHSLIDGDQSHHTYRKLGDLISSLFTLGYHEQVDPDNSIPDFLKDLRRAAFAGAYSADKNLSLFLGRPPRVLRRFCKFRLPRHIPEDIDGGDIAALLSQSTWKVDEPFDHMKEIGWFALCAVLKEEIMHLSHDANKDARLRKADTIQAIAEAQWTGLPPHFRLEDSLKYCNRKPVEKDFLVSVKLNHLHVLLLLRLSLVRFFSDPDQELIRIAARMLNLIVEAMVLKNHLTRSTTGLVWKVTYYGLPAAGIICLTLLNNNFSFGGQEASRVSFIQNLSVLVAEIEMGAIALSDDPNYALLSRAAGTVHRVLAKATSTTGEQTLQLSAEDASILRSSTATDEDWLPWTSQDLYDFEMDFWLHLAEHPDLTGTHEHAQIL